MADTSNALFYNSDNGDRVYDADSFEHLLKKFFTSGVFTGACQVTADGENMTCEMAAGYSNCDGKIRFFDSSESLSLQNAHATYNRIDTVVIERNDTDREITCKVVTGTYSANPVATAPIRSGGIYQLVLAEIYVAAGATKITQSNITDKRPDTSVCGYVMCAVDTPDFSELYAQFLSQAADVIENETDTIENWYSVETAAFNTWFQSMKDQLDTDAAGHLQLEIDGLDDRITVLESKAILIEGSLTAYNLIDTETITNAKITETMTPFVQFEDETVFTSNVTISVVNGSVSVSARLYGTTSFRLLLIEGN